MKISKVNQVQWTVSNIRHISDMCVYMLLSMFHLNNLNRSHISIRFIYRELRSKFPTKCYVFMAAETHSKRPFDEASNKLKLRWFDSWSKAIRTSENIYIHTHILLCSWMWKREVFNVAEWVDQIFNLICHSLETLREYQSMWPIEL